jgi:hypothetical protein
MLCEVESGKWDVVSFHLLHSTFYILQKRGGLLHYAELVLSVPGFCWLLRPGAG